MRKTHVTAQRCALKSSGSKIIGIKMVGRGTASQREHKSLGPLTKEAGRPLDECECILSKKTIKIR